MGHLVLTQPIMLTLWPMKSPFSSTVHNSHSAGLIPLAYGISRLDLGMPFSVIQLKKPSGKDSNGPQWLWAHTQSFPSVCYQAEVNKHKVNPKETLKSIKIKFKNSQINRGNLEA